MRPRSRCELPALRERIPPSAVVVVAGDVLSSDLGSEYVLLNLRDGIYYGLEDVGSRIWRLVQKPVSVAEICDAIVETHDVDPERCRRDVVTLIGELVERRLVEVCGPAGGR